MSSFGERNGELDVKRIATLDLKKIVTNVDVDSLQDVLENIAFCQLSESDLSSMTDGLIVKTFHVAQLIIEYLWQLQSKLSDDNRQLASMGSEINDEVEQICSDNCQLLKDNDRLKKELQVKHKLLVAYDKAVSAIQTQKCPACSSDLDNLAFPSKMVVKSAVCQTCFKAFENRVFLQNHCERRQHSMLIEDTQSDIVYFPAIASQQSEPIDHVPQSKAKVIEARLQAMMIEQEAVYKSRIAALEAQLNIYKELVASSLNHTFNASHAKTSTSERHAELYRLVLSREDPSKIVVKTHEGLSSMHEKSMENSTASSSSHERLQFLTLHDHKNHEDQLDCIRSRYKKDEALQWKSKLALVSLIYRIADAKEFCRLAQSFCKWKASKVDVLKHENTDNIVTSKGSQLAANPLRPWKSLSDQRICT